jgi:hypothetical protein
VVASYFVYADMGRCQKMSKFVELVEQYPDGKIRFTKATDPFRQIGPHDPGDGKLYLYIWEDGEPLRMLSKREISALLIDVDDDWRVSNQ